MELFVNGVSQGRQTLNLLGHVEWDNVPYAPGTIQAIGYNNGVAVITNTVETTGAPAQIALVPDRDTILADGRDVSVVTVEVLDAQGRVVPTATNLVNFSDHRRRDHWRGQRRSQFSRSGQGQQPTLRFQRSGRSHRPVRRPAWRHHPDRKFDGFDFDQYHHHGSRHIAAAARTYGMAAVGGNAQVAVSWDIVPGAITYNLWRATTSGAPYTLIAGNIGGVNLGFLDTNVTNLATYYYVATANGNGTSANSAQVSATPVPVATGLTATVTNGQVVLNWNGSPGASCNVKRSAVSGGPYDTIASPVVGTNYTDYNVATCQTCFYVVTITNGGFESLPSNEAGTEVPGVLPPQFTNADIGLVGLSGSASYCGGQFAISGSGGDIWGTADAFQFVYTYVPVSTNCDIRARVLSVENTSGNAKAAVMIRESLAADSSHATADIEPSRRNRVHLAERHRRQRGLQHCLRNRS